MWSDQCLEVDGCSSVDFFEVQHHLLESDAGHNRKSVEVTEEGVTWGKVGMIVNKVRCSVLDTLQRFNRIGWEYSEGAVAIVQMGDDQSVGTPALMSPSGGYAPFPIR